MPKDCQLMTKRTVTRTYRLKYMNDRVFIWPLMSSRTIWMIISEFYFVLWGICSLETIYSFPLIGNIVTHYSFPPHTHGRNYRFSIALLRENRIFYFECGYTDFDPEGLMDRRRTHFNKKAVCLFGSNHGKDYYLLEAK